MVVELVRPVVPDVGAAYGRVVQEDAPRTLLFDTRQHLGEVAAADAAQAIRSAVRRRGVAHVVFASAPSQQEFLATLATLPGVPWDRVIGFHLDEYVGLPASAPQAFGQFLRDRLFNRVEPLAVHYLDGNAPDVGAECARYTELLRAHPLDVACIGIGENGHLAFNDPHVADFADPLMVKEVVLDERCREQQVHDGCFRGLEDVPRMALTLTMPAILAAGEVFCMVPGPTKALAVQAALHGPLSTACPASALRTHPRATLYLDLQSAALL